MPLVESTGPKYFENTHNFGTVKVVEVAVEVVALVSVAVVIVVVMDEVVVVLVSVFVLCWWYC